MSKKIFISKKCGYCMGVRNAFDKSYKIAESYKNICLYGEIVHNKFALQTLFEKNIILKNNLNDIIYDKSIKYVIIRAHGISPKEEEILKSNEKILFDLTCPNVKKVQNLAYNKSKQGSDIIIFGKPTHPEVIGISGYCLSNCYIINNTNEIDQIINKKLIKPVLISQTTANPLLFSQLSQILKEKIENIEIINTLCKAPINIQEESIKLSQKVQIMLIVGDKMSANTTTLFELTKKNCLSYFIETIDDLKNIDFDKIDKIGITGGSSTPQWQINNIKDYLIEKYNFT